MGGLSHYFSVLVWIEHLWKSPSVMWWIHVEDIIFCAGRKWFDQGAVKESEPNWQNTCQPWRNSRQIHHKVCCDILVHNRRRHPSSLGRHLRNSFHSSGWETGPESCQPNEITGRLAGSTTGSPYALPFILIPSHHPLGCISTWQQIQWREIITENYRDSLCGGRLQVALALPHAWRPGISYCAAVGCINRTICSYHSK